MSSHLRRDFLLTCPSVLAGTIMNLFAILNPLVIPFSACPSLRRNAMLTKSALVFYGAGYRELALKPHDGWLISYTVVWKR